MSELAAQQRQFLNHMRHPQSPLPPGANVRAMGIYAELVYRNLAGLINQFFPVSHQVCTSDAWEALIRQFIAQHPSQTPYFLAIAEEFLQFLLSQPTSLAALPDYLPELAHYEWVELALDIAESPQPEPAPSHLDVWHGHWQLSPVAWCLAYQYPVHLIGATNPNPPKTPSAYVVYRNRALEVEFVSITLPSAQWLHAINAETTPRQALLSTISGPLSQVLEAQTAALLKSWVALEILVPAAR